MRTSICVFAIMTLLLSVSTKAQDTPLELPIVFELDSETTIIDADWNFDSTLLAFADGNDGVSIADVVVGTIALQVDSVTNEIGVISAIGWSSTRNHLLIANNLTKIWDYTENEWLDDFEFPSALTSVEYTPGNFDWHPEDNQFAIVLRECDEGTQNRPGARIEIWDVTNSKFTQIANCISRGFGSVKWNPEGTRLAINGFSVLDDEGLVDFEQIEIWDVDAREEFLTINNLRDPSGLTWNPKGDTIAFTTTVGLDRHIQVWSVADNELVWQVEASLGMFAPLDWHPSENMIVTGGEDGAVRIWDSLSGMELIELPVHEDAVNDVSWSPDGSMLVSAGRDGKLFVWDVSELIEDE